jgi:diacylglycerol O-acyltransferase/trehalose O-mycolyltransferase
VTGDLAIRTVPGPSGSKGPPVETWAGGVPASGESGDMGKRLFALGAAAGALLGVSLSPALATTTGTGQRPSATAGLTLLAFRHLDARLEELTFRTNTLPAPTNVRILLPVGYATHPEQRYPVLYLLHGISGSSSDWTEKGGAEAATAAYPMIVVMPDAEDGFYTNWFDGGPQWETYHVEQLIPWVDAHYRTEADRAGRAIAGLSMGGFGAFSYAARHPDLFSAAASFSGALDTGYPSDGDIEESTIPAATVLGALSVEDSGNAERYWGPPLTEDIVRRAHNPWDLASNLRGMSLTIRTGDGLPGPYDQNGIDPVDTGIEAAVGAMSVEVQGRLTSLGIPDVFDDYGPGTHSWPYWHRDLVQTLPTIMADFDAHPAAPTSWSYRAAEASYQVYGWTVSIDRPAEEFSTLSVAPGRFSLAGSGAATVITPASYQPGHRYVLATDEPGGLVLDSVRADRQGRLHIGVNLGPGNPYPEYSVAAQAVGTQVRTVTVQVDES